MQLCIYCHLLVKKHHQVLAQCWERKLVNRPLSRMLLLRSRYLLRGVLSHVGTHSRHRRTLWSAYFASTTCHKHIHSHICCFPQTPRIVVQDPKALSHLVRNAYDYPKTNIIRGEIGRGIGHGLLWAEGSALLSNPSALSHTLRRRLGDIHRKQRKMLNPAFSRPNVRELAPAFTSLALEVRIVLLAPQVSS